MGTSKSSKGSPSNVQSTPSWTPNPLDGNDQSDVSYAPHNTGAPVGGDEFDPEVFPNSSSGSDEELAPPRRHLGARKGISAYARTGARDSLKSGLKNYVKTSFGGSRKAAKRLGGATKSAGILYNALSSISDQIDYTGQSDLLSKEVLSTKTPAEIIDYIVDTLAPLDGTQDSETRQWSMNNALSDLYKEFPDADIENLNKDQIDYTVECFAIEELLRRFELDLEQTIIENAPSNLEGIKRSKDAKSFIREVAHSSFDDLKTNGKSLTTDNVAEVVDEAYIITCEGFLED